MNILLVELFRPTTGIFNYGIFQMLQLHLHFLWTYKLTPLTAQSWPTSLISVLYVRGSSTASTGTLVDIFFGRAAMNTLSLHLLILFSDVCRHWCGKFVILNTTPKHSTSQGPSLSPQPSLSLTSCCSLLSEYVFINPKGVPFEMCLIPANIVIICVF